MELLRELVRVVRQREALILIYATALFCFLAYHGPFGLLPEPYRGIEPWLTEAVLYVGTAFLFSLLVLRENPLHFGLGRGDVRAWTGYLVVLGLVMAAVNLVVSRRPEFAAHYPLWHPARDSLGLFLLYSLSTVVYMFGWEYFFRGFLLFSLARKYGNFAVVLQMVPFVLAHRGKPELEMFGAIVGGLVLGVLALRTRSMWPCFLLHAFVAVWMDVCVVYVWR
jgi:membrane protease YdiL (CAAX protease family)